MNALHVFGSVDVLWTVRYSADQNDRRPLTELDHSVAPTLRQALELAQKLYTSGYVVYEIRQDETRTSLTREDIEIRLGRPPAR